jgi:copper chaperone CopZ
MKQSRFLVAMSLGLALVAAGAARAETTVVLKSTHLCCPMCVAAVGKILKTVDGVTGECDRAAKTVTITAPDAATAQKALDALAAGGFHGDTGNKDLAIKDDSGAAKGKVKSLTLVGIHDCCGMCNAAIKKALKTVDGVKEDTAMAKSDTFEVTGDFDAAAVVKALNAAGYHVKVKK